MNTLTNINYKSVIVLVLAFALSIASTFNTKILMLTLFLLTFLFLLGTKKLFSFIYMLPFLAISFIPSAFVQIFTINTPIGTMKPSTLLILAMCVCFIFLRVFKIDISLLRENITLLSSLFIFFLVSVVATSIHGFNIANFKVSLLTFILSFFFLVFTLISNGSIDSFKTIKGVLYLSSIVCLLGIIEFFGIQLYLPLYMLDREFFAYNNVISEGLPRVVSSIGNPIVLSGYLILCLPIVLYVRATESRKLLWNIIALLHVACVMLTISRSAIAIMFLSSVFLLTKTEKIKLKTVVKILSLLFISATLFYFVLDSSGLIESFKDRILFRSNSESVSYDVRMQAFDIAFNIISHMEPFFGLGQSSIGGYLVNTHNFTNGTLENTFLTILVGLGFVGLISFVFLLLALWKSFSKLEYNLRMTGYSLLITLILFSMFIGVLPYESIWGVFWFFSGLLILHNKSLKNSVND